MGKKPVIIDELRKVEGSALTASFANVGPVLASDAHHVFCFNSCDECIVIKLNDGGEIELDVGQSFTMDLKNSQLVLGNGSQLQAKAFSGLAIPVNGNVRFTVLRG